MNFMRFSIFVILFCFLCKCAAGESRSAAEEATYTQKEVVALEKFKNHIEASGLELAPWMQRDEYLIIWLRARDLNVARAVEMLTRNVNWRKAERIDELMTEDFSSIQNALPYDLQSVDRQGRPVLMVDWGGRWDIRRLVVAGRLPQLLRYLNWIALEEPATLAREAGQRTGTNSTQFIELMDLAGYSLWQHACMQCLRVYLFYTQTYENYYPQLAKEKFVFNTPFIFTPIIQLTKPFWSAHLTNHVHFMRSNRQEWAQRVGKFIDLEELPEQFGGRNKRKIAGLRN